MVKKRIEILSTKILDETVIKQAASENISIDCLPFIEIKTINSEDLQQQVESAIEKTRYTIFTSANAVDAVAKNLNHRPQLNVFCISGKTRKAVEERFPGSIIIADAPNGGELAEKIINQKIDSAVFFCGNKRLDTIPDQLRKHDINLQEIVVYETITTPKKIDKNYDGVLFFSPSAVESFFSVNERIACKVAFSFAASTHHSLQPIVDEIIVSQTPSEQAMINTVIEYYKTKFQTKLKS